jgi:hypothetical protein
VSQSFNTAVADSPPIDLTLATNPVLSFWAWDHTEGGTFDGWNLKVSTNGGQRSPRSPTVTPAYPLTISGQPAWGGDHTRQAGRTTGPISAPTPGRRSSCASPSAATARPSTRASTSTTSSSPSRCRDPLYITTPSLPDVYAGMPYTARSRGTAAPAGAVWSIVPGGVNDAWLSIDPVTGRSRGTPSRGDGPGDVTVRVEEPTLPSNFDDKTFTFNVNLRRVLHELRGRVPERLDAGVTWQCGVPDDRGARERVRGGTQCVATRDRWQLPHLAVVLVLERDLTRHRPQQLALPDPHLPDVGRHRGRTFDGVNLKISTDGGMNYSIVASATPPYPLTVAGEPAWGGHLSGARLAAACRPTLAAYAGRSCA